MRSKCYVYNLLFLEKRGKIKQTHNTQFCTKKKLAHMHAGMITLKLRMKSHWVIFQARTHRFRQKSNRNVHAREIRQSDESADEREKEKKERIPYWVLQNAFFSATKFWTSTKSQFLITQFTSNQMTFTQSFDSRQFSFYPISFFYSLHNERKKKYPLCIEILNSCAKLWILSAIDNCLTIILKTYGQNAYFFRAKKLKSTRTSFAFLEIFKKGSHNTQLWSDNLMVSFGFFFSCYSVKNKRNVFLPRARVSALLVKKFRLYMCAHTITWESIMYDEKKILWQFCARDTLSIWQTNHRPIYLNNNYSGLWLMRILGWLKWKITFEELHKCLNLSFGLRIIPRNVFRPHNSQFE